MANIQAAVKNSGASDQCQRLRKEILESGQLPELICFLREREKHTPIGMLIKEPLRKALLLFTSPVLAHFFIQTKQLPLEVVGIKLEEIASQAEHWRAHGFDAFIMNPSPKAATFNILNAENNLISRDKFVFAWANNRAVRNWQAQVMLVDFYTKTNCTPGSPEMLQKQRESLEFLRDNGCFDVPFVHWMLALIAGMQGDEPGRLAATATLESFGPAFVGKTVRLEGEVGMKAWANSMATADTGLMAEFGILKGPDGLPMKSILRSEMQPQRS